MLRLRRISHHQLWAVFAALVLLRALVPTGWMPSFGPQGTELILCSATGAGKALIDLGIPNGEQASVAHEPCAFAGLGLPLIPLVPQIAAPLAALLLDGTPPTGPPTAPVETARRLPPATAPPALR